MFSKQQQQILGEIYLPEGFKQVKRRNVFQLKQLCEILQVALLLSGIFQLDHVPHGSLHRQVGNIFEPTVLKPQME